MAGLIKNIILLFLIINNVSYGQNTSCEHLDTLVNTFLNELKTKGIDTICVYESFFVGGNKWFNIEKVDTNRCDYFDDYKPTYIMWVQNGRTYLSKKDNCFDYSIIEIGRPAVWNTFFNNRSIINTEKVQPFTYSYSENGKKGTGIIGIDHSGQQNFKIFISNDTIAMYFDDFDLQNYSDEKKNINYKHNINLKSKRLIDDLEKLVRDIEDRRLLNKTRRKF